MAHLGEEGLMASTVKSYLSAVRQLAISQGQPDFSQTPMPRLKQIIKGVGVVRGKEGRTTRRKRPITAAILRQMGSTKAVTPPQGANWEMFWAASCLAFFGFLRAGELTVPSAQRYDASYHLNLADISANHKSQPSVMHVKIKASKTDPFRRGMTVVLGATGKDLCPVRALIDYLKVRGKRPGSLFVQSDGTPLTKAVFVRWVQQTLRKVGLDEREYAGHSFRVGAATTAAAVGIQDSLIKAMGRWESSAYLLYIRMPTADLQQVATRLV